MGTEAAKIVKSAHKVLFTAAFGPLQFEISL
jgi:hypothetical protein